MNKKTKKLVGLFILLALLVVGTFFINTKESVKEVIVEKQNQPERTVPVEKEPVVEPSSLDTNITKQDPSKICEQIGLHEVKRIPFESSTLHTCIKNSDEWNKEDDSSHRAAEVVFIVSKGQNITWSKEIEGRVYYPKVVKVDKRNMIEIVSSGHGGSCTSAGFTTYLFDPIEDKSSSVTELSSMVNDCDDDEITTIINSDGTAAMKNYLLDMLKKSMDSYANQQGCKYTSPFPNPIVYCEINRNQ